MFNPFRRKKKTPWRGWLWIGIGLVLTSAVSAWCVVDVQWWMLDAQKAKLAELDLDNQLLATQLHGMKRFEGTEVGDLAPRPDHECAPLALIGTYAGGPATAAGEVLQAMSKRDPALTAADLGPITALAAGFSDPAKAETMGVTDLALRLADGGITWLAPGTVKLGELYEVATTDEYRARHAESLCMPHGQSRPELTTCVPQYLTLLRGNIYLGRFVPGCADEGRLMNQR